MVPELFRGGAIGRNYRSCRVNELSAKQKLDLRGLGGRSCWVEEA